MKNVYFVLYGEFEYLTGGSRKFGDRVGLGWTIGEEILFLKSEPIKRLETVKARSNACLLQLKKSDLESMAKVGLAGGRSFKADYDTLMGFLVQNYESKQKWRNDAGIL